MWVLGAAVLLLAGCAAVPGDPVSAAERAHIRSVLLNEQWGEIQGEYPESIRPSVPETLTVADHDYPDLMVACLNGLGYHAVRTDNGYINSAAQGQTALEMTVESYVCTARYIPVSKVLPTLSRAQVQAYQQFESSEVRPCLQQAGAPTGVEYGIQGNPYDVVWQLRYPARQLAYLELRCPPIPSWLNLRE